MSIAAERVPFPAMRRPFARTWVLAGMLSGVLAILVAHYPLGIGADYPNHLARTYIEGWLSQSQALQQYFQLEFKIVPDLSMDMIIPWLSHLIGTYEAGAVTVWMALALPALAGVVISRRVHGDAAGWLPLIGFAAAFNMSMQWGFINYALSTGLALFALWGWMRSGAGWRRALLFAPLSAVLALNHGFAFLLFGYMAVLFEGSRFAIGERGNRFAFARGLMLRDAIAFLPGLAVILLAAMDSSDLPKSGGAMFDLASKFAATTAGFQFFNPLVALFATLGVGGGLYLGLRRGVLTMDRDLGIICAGLIGLIVIAPVYALGIWGAHLRFTAVLFILLGTAVRFSPDATDTAKRTTHIAIAALLAVVFINGGAHLSRTDAELQEIRTALQTVEPGSKLIQAIDEPRGLSGALHSSALAVIDRQAYVPHLFTNTSPVAIQPHMAALHRPQGKPVEKTTLEAATAVPPVESANGHWSVFYYYGWTETFDYVLYHRLPGAAHLDVDGLTVAYESDTTVIYKIDR
ncbi:MAG: hypothetical protein AAFY43_07605 [Pseudomonadota bacterium]